jgi:transaldolase / glucose-6-phosphate isomerase
MAAAGLVWSVDYGEMMTNLNLSLPGVQPAPHADLAARIWAKDAKVWGPGDDDPADRLGWLTLPGDFTPLVPEVRAFAASAAQGVEAVVLLGMGGSSLAPEVFARTLPAERGSPSLVVADSTHPAQIRAVRDELDLDRTLFVVSSKSGGTIETMSLYRYFRALVPDGRRYVAITDPGTSLERLAAEEGFLRTFLNPPDIGGRYSALSYFGLVPAALAGVELEGLLASALDMQERCGADRPAGEDPGLVLGGAIGGLAKEGRDKLTFLISEEIESFGDWVEQLLAESTGKHGTGIVPIVREPERDASAYGDDRAFVHLKVEGDGGRDELVRSLSSSGHPVITSTIAEPNEIGGEMYLWEFATAVAGSVLGINAFDQPDVESAKKASRELLESGADLEWSDDDPARLFDGARAPELAVVCAFAPRSPAAAAVLKEARLKLVTDHGVATMAGFGPRYLHSTGQLHKGGPPNVRALVVLDPPDGDEPIPGTPHGFARLVAAQAAGDASALETAGRQVARTTWSNFVAWVQD